MSRQEKRMSGAFILLLMMFLFVALIALYFLMGYFSQRSDQLPEDSGKIPEFAEIDLDGVDTFCYDYNGALQTFIKSDGKWIYADDENLKLNSAMIESMLSVLDGLEYHKIVSDTLPTSLEYGFDSPEMTITLGFSDGTQKILYVGSRNPMVEQYYAIAEGDHNIYMIDSQIVQAFLPVSDLTETEEPPENEEAGEDRGVTEKSDKSESSDVSGSDSEETGEESGD